MILNAFTVKWWLMSLIDTGSMPDLCTLLTSQLTLVWNHNQFMWLTYNDIYIIVDKALIKCPPINAWDVYLVRILMSLINIADAFSTYMYDPNFLFSWQSTCLGPCPSGKWECWVTWPTGKSPCPRQQVGAFFEPCKFKYFVMFGCWLLYIWNQHQSNCWLGVDSQLS